MRTNAKQTQRKGSRAGVRKMTTKHKAALVEGRRMSAIVDRYLNAINAPKQRGRKVATTTLRKRLAEAEARNKTATGVERVLAAQEVRDLRARLDSSSASEDVDLKALETAFVRVARTFSDNRGISYSAWRDVGVPAPVLKRAGVPRTRD